MALVIGTSEDKMEYARAKGIKKEAIDPDIVPQQQDENQAVDVLGENVTPLDDDELTMLRRVHLRRDPFTVYMQPDMDFYDIFYRDDNQLDELTLAARQIKRVYANADDYFYAQDVRDAYIDMIIERDFDGSAYRYNRALDAGEIWEPPAPFYSRKAKDYDLVSQGIRFVPTSTKTVINVDRAKEVLESILVSRGIDRETPLTTYESVVTDYWILDELEDEHTTNRLRSNTGRLVMSVTDLDAVRSTLEDVYNNRTKKKPKGIFSQTKKRIEEDYWESFKVDIAELKREIEAEQVEDNTAMVYDNVSNRPMQRGEYKKRVLVRKLKDIGWSELPVMKAMNVGSGYERRQLEKKNAQIRKLKKQARVILEDAGAISPVPDNTYTVSGEPIPDFDPVSELQKYFQGGSS